MFSRKCRKAEDLGAEFKKEMAEIFLLLKDPSVPADRKEKAKGRLDEIERALQGHVDAAKRETGRLGQKTDQGGPA